ncbi:MAG TPA: hypothetical protein VG435_16690 [Acidimicrobiales bacterium]|jgi:CheY-like chemotaxis protein|nr:hypothetical protein [Acidimicrobiales bacterium]
MLSADDAVALDILLVEDDPGDVMLTSEGLARSKVLHHLAVAPDGESALEHLRAATPKPVSFDSFVEVVCQIGEFFFGVVRADDLADAG